MLRDHLICEVNDTRIQQRLLAEPKPLTLMRAFEVAQAIETAEQDTKDLVVAQGHNSVFHVQKAVHMTCPPIFTVARSSTMQQHANLREQSVFL